MSDKKAFECGVSVKKDVADGLQINLTFLQLILNLKKKKWWRTTLCCDEEQ